MRFKVILAVHRVYTLLHPLAIEDKLNNNKLKLVENKSKYLDKHKFEAFGISVQN